MNKSVMNPLGIRVGVTKLGDWVGADRTETGWKVWDMPEIGFQMINERNLSEAEFKQWTKDNSILWTG